MDRMIIFVSLAVFGVTFIGVIYFGPMFYGANNAKIQELNETLSVLQHSIELVQNEMKTHSRDTMHLHQQHHQNFIGLNGSVEEIKQKNDGHIDSHDNHDQEIVNGIELLNQTVQELQEKISKLTLETQSPNNLSNEIDHLKQEVDSIGRKDSMIVYGIICLGLVSIVLFGYRKYKKYPKNEVCPVKCSSSGEEKLNNVFVDQKC